MSTTEAKETSKGPIPTQDQVSAGGVAFRRGADGVEVAIVRVPPKDRWQLPKGLVAADEALEATAVREVREEAGIDTELIAPLETIEYWYYGHNRGRRVRFHKFVHFYLLAYRSGNTSDHDWEVAEARWVDIATAQEMLSFKSEQAVVAQAREMIAALEQ